MIDKEILKKNIKEIFREEKSLLKNNNIKFSRVEEYISEEKLQWLLSIVLNEYFGSEEINEIVIETMVEIQEERVTIKADLSLGNGFIIKEKSIEYNKYSVDNSSIINFLKEDFFKNIHIEIDKEIDNLTLK